MVELRKITGYMDALLNVSEIKDTSFNGLQVEGKYDVKRIIFAVDAGIDTFKKAVEDRAEMVVVHHGIFWDKSNPSIAGPMKERVDLLLRNGISLYAAHLPLDVHKDVGNNAQLIKVIGARLKEGFHEYSGQEIGWIGEFNPAMPLKDIEIRLNAEIGAKSVLLPFGRDMIRSVAVCSGGGGYGAFFDALKKNADLYITGDSVEVYHSAKDEKINVIFAGHHNTETLGPKALCQAVKSKFKIEAYFVDLPTGL